MGRKRKKEGPSIGTNEKVAHECQAFTSNVGTQPSLSKPQDETSVKPPDIVVEGKILDRLTTERLLDKNGLKALKGELASGTLSSEDWKLAFENAIERERQDK